MARFMKMIKPNAVIDVTARKTQKIEFLQRQVNDASTVVAEATAKYNSFVDKANTFALLYQEAEVDLQTAEAYWKLFQQVRSDLNGLNQTAAEANLVAVDAFYDVKQLILKWESVTSDTLKAAEAIILAADYIQKRKASNNLIFNDLVTDAANAAKSAQKTVKLVVNALSDALGTLSASAQANNSTELVDVYIGQAIAKLLKKAKDSQALQDLLADNQLALLKEEETKVFDLAMSRLPLESSLGNSVEQAKKRAKMALSASESANREMNKAKEELAQAEAALATWEAALLAAETAVAG